VNVNIDNRDVSIIYGSVQHRPDVRRRPRYLYESTPSRVEESGQVDVMDSSFWSIYILRS